MKILFIGTIFGNAHLQFNTLRRLYKKVDKIEPFKKFSKSRIFTQLFCHISPKIFEYAINTYVLSQIKHDYDLIYVKSGEFIGEKLINILKKKTKKIAFFCNDNPFLKRDNQRWKLFLKAAKYYDLIVFQDQSRIKLSKKNNLNNTLLVLPPYDEVVHKKKFIDKTKKNYYENDVIFVGTWSHKKGVFLKKLIDLGIKTKIYGSRWHKDKNYQLLKNKIKLGHFKNQVYSKLIQRTKIALCLFADENLDTITARSIEIPAIGTLMLSARTPAMKKVLIENKEAIYFNNAKECAEKCKYYLNNHKKRKKIAQMGNRKVTKILKSSNTFLIKKIISKLFK